MDMQQLATHIVENKDQPDAGAASLFNALENQIAKTFETEQEREVAREYARQEAEMARAKFIRSQLTEYLTTDYSGLFHHKVLNLCDNMVELTDEPGKFSIPNPADVLYNLVTYSHIALERLRYNEKYVTGWRTPDQVGMIDGRSYVVMLAVGYICPGVYDAIEKVMKLRINGSQLDIDPHRLLSIHATIDDGLDFLRGVPMLTYEALAKVTAGRIDYVHKRPRHAMRTTVPQSAKDKRRKTNKQQKTARRNNRK